MQAIMQQARVTVHTETPQTAQVTIILHYTCFLHLPNLLILLKYASFVVIVLLMFGHFYSFFVIFAKILYHNMVVVLCTFFLCVSFYL